MRLVVKNAPANAGDIRDVGSIPELGRSPVGGHGNPLQYSSLENLYGQRSKAGYSPQGRKELDMTEATEHTYPASVTLKALLGMGIKTSHTLYQKCYKCDGSIRVKEKHRRKSRFSIHLSGIMTLKKEKKKTMPEEHLGDTHTLNESYKINILLRIIVKPLKCCSKNPKLHGVFYEGV